MRLLAAVVLVSLGVVAGVGVYFGVDSFQIEETPRDQLTELTPGPEPSPGIPDETECIWATPPPYADTQDPICARECPECFPELPPGPPEFQPCEEPQDTSLLLPAYESLAKLDTKDWQRYESPHYPWSFLYPPEWKLEVIEYSDLYGDVKGPMREVLKLWDPTAMSHVTDVAAPGAVSLTISAGPRSVDSFCPESQSVRKVKADVSLADKPTRAEIVVQDVPEDDPQALWKGINYSFTATIRADDHVLIHAVLGTQSPSHLGIMRALLESMRWAQSG